MRRTPALQRALVITAVVLLALAIVAGVVGRSRGRAKPWSVVATQAVRPEPQDNWIDLRIDYVAPTGGIVQWQRFTLSLNPHYITTRAAGLRGVALTDLAPLDAWTQCWLDAKVGKPLPACAREEPSSFTPMPTPAR